MSLREALFATKPSSRNWEMASLAMTEGNVMLTLRLTLTKHHVTVGVDGMESHTFPLRDLALSEQETPLPSALFRRPRRTARPVLDPPAPDDQ
jgi:hypothetical protein